MARPLRRSGFGEDFLRPVFPGAGVEHKEVSIPGGHALSHGEQQVEQAQTR